MPLGCVQGKTSKVYRMAFNVSVFNPIKRFTACILFARIIDKHFLDVIQDAKQVLTTSFPENNCNKIRMQLHRWYLVSNK